MRRTREWMIYGLLLAAPALLAQSPAAQTAAPPASSTAPAATSPSPDASKPSTATPATSPHHNSHRAAQKEKPVELPPMPTGPLSQVPMDQIPATPAKVSYQDGLLTISAQNSTLGEILRDVRKLTGASIEIPPGGGSERVVTHLGPGKPRDVLAVLLNGSSFNYVMLGSGTDPAAVATVVLMAKPSASGETRTAANVNQAPPGAVLSNGAPVPEAFNRRLIGPHPGQPGYVQPADDDNKDDDQAADENADDQTQPGQAAQPEANSQEQQAQQPDPNQPNAGPRTPEQILEQLRRQQQPAVPYSPPEPPPTPPQ